MSKTVDAINAADNALAPLEERATLLSYAGLLPFLVTAMALWVSPFAISYGRAGMFLNWELRYGALILTFLGGIRWGLAMLDDKKVSDYVTINQLTNSVVPLMIGWLAVIPANFVPGIDPNFLARHIVLLLAFGLLAQADRTASEDGFAPPWYGPLRIKVTFFLTLIFLLIMMRLIDLGW